MLGSLAGFAISAIKDFGLRPCGVVSSANMSNPGNGFWQQYQENVRAANRNAPWRLLRVLVAFGLTLVLAPCSMVVAEVTGSPTAAMVFAIVGIVSAVVLWRLIWWLFERQPQQALPDFHGPALSAIPPSTGSPFASGPFYQQAPSTQAYTPPAQPLLGASAGPRPPFAPEPRRSGSSGCVIAIVALLGLSLFTCCGGAAALFAFAPKLNFRAGPNAAVNFGPANAPAFGPPAGNPFPGGDPFADFQRRQQQHLEDVRQRHDEIMRQHEAQMRELERQIETDRRELLEPGF
jgi:hypothetical protein